MVPSCSLRDYWLSHLSLLLFVKSSSRSMLSLVVAILDERRAGEIWCERWIVLLNCGEQGDVSMEE